MAEEQAQDTGERVQLNSDNAVADAMSRFVDPPSDRDEKGRFKGKEGDSEEQPATQEADATEESAEPVEPVYISDEDLLKKAKIKVQDEEFEVTLKDALDGHMRQSDYTKKTQELAAQRRSVEKEASDKVEVERKNYLSQLQVLQGVVIRAAQPELANVNWQELAQVDPAKYVALQAKAQQVHQTLQSLLAEQKRISDESERKSQEDFQQKSSEGAEKLAAKIPNWNDDLKKSLVERGTKTYGFSDNEIAQFADHRIVEMLHDAHQYHMLKDQKPLVDKKVQQALKVMKPSAREAKPSPTDQQRQQARSNLKKTGSIDAFADALRL